ncbi:TPA: hypothetical protein ACF9H0_002411 [Staphylococcus aureus]|uniref:hypothetical protein n=1 Tax=Staphylococcus TaxID=1279 RepID=UPI0004672EA0|nr:hypothetical protein [Staphylococcus epidermidis]MBE5677250.1 hypothetical protein [Staphylococcus singaporensis]NKP41933.1 hypothetical protein [Staphylococcus aureus]MCG1466867.1 hypothetical protein [Staphylococcus epidermidis]MCG1567031.1 hypothetical protein [Staphylococcus epidermidis]NKP83771.1 hypothetical protein [Staphylococcus aureus]
MEKLNENTVRTLKARDIIQNEKGKLYIVEHTNDTLIKIVEMIEGVQSTIKYKHLIGYFYIGKLNEHFAFGYNF